jgi:hypothetical protein
MTPTTDESADQARALDALLAADVVAPPSDGLRRAILFDFQARTAGGFWRALWREIGGLQVAAPALGASLAVGIAVATMLEPALPPAVPAPGEAPGYAELAMLDGGYEGYLP